MKNKSSVSKPSRVRLLFTFQGYGAMSNNGKTITETISLTWSKTSTCC
ncbi:hypothetical protein [Sphingobacterium puteale]